MEGVLGPVLIALIGTTAGIVATYLAARRLAQLGLGDSQLQVNKSLRELAETEKAKREIREEDLAEKVEGWERERVRLHEELLAMTRERDRYRDQADDCDRRLTNAYVEMRQTGRLTDRRKQARTDEETGERP